jgi:hypothetical protein
MVLSEAAARVLRNLKIPPDSCSKMASTAPKMGSSPTGSGQRKFLWHKELRSPKDGFVSSFFDLQLPLANLRSTRRSWSSTPHPVVRQGWPALRSPRLADPRNSTLCCPKDGPPLDQPGGPKAGLAPQLFPPLNLGDNLARDRCAARSSAIRVGQAPERSA